MNDTEIQKTPLKHKIDYIKSHLAGYESIIKSSISNGLLDEAVLFEEFARKICEFYFEQSFINLNSIKLGWKCVDLVSQDKTIYVQVSATKYTNLKIKETNKKLSELKKENDVNVAGIKRIVFFLLNSVELKSIDETLVYDIVFKPKEDIVTFDTIFNKIKNDETFRNNVFNYIHSEEESVKDLDTKLFDISQKAKNIYLTDIENTIGDGSFHIDRTTLLENIKKSKNRIVVISGAAGVGKSAVCKEIIRDSCIILFARAEEVINSKNINDLWNVNVREVLKYTGNKEVVMCIDSLEFVADSLCKDKLLEEIFFLTKEFNYLKIFVTCRTREKDCFSNLFTKYKDSMSVFTVDKLTSEEKKNILNHFPTLKKLSKKFIDLIDTPLYADIIIKQTITDKIANETELKNVIYKKCICLKDKKAIKKKKQIEKAIRLIVVERAKTRKLGIDQSLLDDYVLEVLLNNGVIINKQYGVRLKYDLFEDICFGHYFNEDFAIKNSVDSFFINLEKKFGSTTLRRYQIWIDDLVKEGNHNMVIDIVLNSHNEEYLKNTIIGLMVSDNSEAILNEFFDNNGLDYKKCIDICNDFAYELSSVAGQYLFKPIGIGRATLINRIPLSLINSKKINIHSVVKLLTDLIQQEQYVELASKKSSEVVEQIYKTELKKRYLDYELLDELATIALYTQEYSKQWFISLIYDVLDKYLHNYFKDGEKIIKNLLEFKFEKSYTTSIKYSKEYLDFMFEISFRFFTVNPDVKKSTSFPFNDYIDDHFTKRYGLSRGADSFLSGANIWQSPKTASFFLSAVRSNLPSSLAYLFKFSDFIGENLKRQGLTEDVSVFINGEERHFLYYQEFSVFGEEETPHLSFLGDMFFTIKHEITQLLDSNVIVSEIKKTIIDTLITICFNYSNTTASLSFLSFFANYLMIYAPSIVYTLSECYQVIMDDAWLYSNENHPDINRLFLEKQIYNFIGVPYKKRYDLKRVIDLGSCLYNLYYIVGVDKEEYKRKIKMIYDKYKNIEDALLFYKNHDGSLRTPKIVAEEQTKEIEKKDTYFSKNEYVQKEIALIMRDCDYGRARRLIKFIVSLPKQEVNLFSRWLVYSISIALMDRNITISERNDYCNIWIKEIDSNSSFYFDNNFIISLISQIKEEISEENKKWIKKYIFSVLISQQDNADKIQQVTPIINLLSVNKELRALYINALVGCSLVHCEVFGIDNSKSFTEKEYKQLLLKKNQSINEIVDSCLFHGQQYNIFDLPLKNCEPFYLEALCELLLTIQNPIIDKGLYIIDYFLDCFECNNYEPIMLSVAIELPHIISDSFILNADVGKIIFGNLLNYVKTHPNNKKAREIINRTLCNLEKLLYGNDFDKVTLFTILDFLVGEYKKVESSDSDNEIKLGLIFINRQYPNSIRHRELYLNAFQKHKLLSLFELNSPDNLNLILSKLLSYPTNILMPDIIPLINTFVKSLCVNKKTIFINESLKNLERFISESYLNYREEIKGNLNLSKCFEELLINLSKYGLSKANVIQYHFNLL